MPNPDNLPQLPKNQSPIIDDQTGIVSRDWYRFFLNLLNKANTAGGSGTVTSVAVSGGTTGLTTSGGPITTAGTITLAGTLAVANGGTGATTSAGARTNLDVPSTTGSGASGTWSIDVTGNAGTVTNGVYTTGSYADPTWITSLAGSKVTGAITGQAGSVANALTAGTGISYSVGTTYDGSVAVTINNSAPDQTVSLTGGTGISTSGTYPSFTITNTLPMTYPGAGIPNSTGTAWGASYTTTGTGTTLVLATSPSLVTPILGTPQSGDFSTGTFTWPTFNQNTTGTASNVTGVVAIANGGTGQTTATAGFDALAPTTTKGDLIVSDGTDNVRQAVGTDTYVLTADSTTATGIKWAASSGAGLTISNDTTTATNVYPTFAAATSGTMSTIYTGNAKLLYKPSTGELTSTHLVASNGIFVNSLTIGTSYTIPSGYSGVSAGIITVSGGVTVTVSSGSRWVVV